jgi:hypothetical protein
MFGLDVVSWCAITEDDSLSTQADVDSCVLGTIVADEIDVAIDILGEGAVEVADCGVPGL